MDGASVGGAVAQAGLWHSRPTRRPLSEPGLTPDLPKGLHTVFRLQYTPCYLILTLIDGDYRLNSCVHA